MNRPKPIVGNRLFCLNIGNLARSRPQALSPVFITSVGRKFFVAAGVKYRLSNWSEETSFCQDHKLYETEQEWQDEVEAERLTRDLRDRLAYGKSAVPLYDLRVAHACVCRIEPKPPTTKGNER